MATFRERQGRHEAIIRKNNIKLSAVFDHLEDAKLWASYKEDLIEQIANFNPPLDKLITLGDAIKMRIDTAIGSGTVDIADLTILYKTFEKYLKTPINEVTYDSLSDHFEHVMSVPVRRGGNHNDPNSGIKAMPSMHTTFRKFSYLSTVFEHLIKEGVKVQNHPLALCKLLRSRLPKK